MFMAGVGALTPARRAKWNPRANSSRKSVLVSLHPSVPLHRRRRSTSSEKMGDGT
jgi:hypothetical protein